MTKPLAPDDVHSKYSPSQLPRIIRCPGSTLLHESQPSSTFAIEGTLCHEVTADHLEKQIYQVDTNHPIIMGFGDTVRDDLVEAIQECLDFTKNLLDDNPGAIVKIETRVSMEGFAKPLACPGLKDVSGTVDLYILVPSKRVLYVVDWKYGAGIEVWPDSEQLITYGIAAMCDLMTMRRFDSVHLYIGQPRLYSGEKFKEHVMLPSDMINWANNTLVPAINACEDGALIFNPSAKACQWCSAKMVCEARLEQSHKDASSIFAAYSDLPNKVTTEQLMEFRKASVRYKSYIKDIEKHIYGTLMNGTDIPGIKLVAGRSNRKWVDTQAFVMWASVNAPDAEIFESKPLSPSKAEKLFKGAIAKRADFQALITKPTGAPTIVLEKDPRPSIKSKSAESVFSDFAKGDD